MEPVLALGAGTPLRRDLGRRDTGRPLAHEALRRPHRLRASREEVFHDALRGATGVLGHLRHEPDPERDVGAEALPGKEVAARRLADPSQDERRDDRGDDPKSHFGEPEDGVRPGDRDVRARDETRPSAERMPVDDADDRGSAGVDRLEHAVQAHRVLDVLLVRQIDGRPLPLDVGSGAEARTLAGEDDGTRVAHVAEGFVQLRDERGVERVPALRAGERHAKDVPVPLDLQRAHEGGA